jgi:hypothetical protein
MNNKRASEKSFPVLREIICFGLSGYIQLSQGPADGHRLSCRPEPAGKAA